MFSPEEDNDIVGNDIRSLVVGARISASIVSRKSYAQPGRDVSGG
jgi:hypothetical protein